MLGFWRLADRHALTSRILTVWDINNSIPGAKCLPQFPQFYINAGGNIVTDVAVFRLPIPILLKLQLRTAQKIFLVCIFSLGLFTVIISGIRIRYLPNEQDTTWLNVESSAWSIVEVSSGILCSCLPTLQPFAKRYLHRFGSGIHAEPGFYRHSEDAHPSNKTLGSGSSNSRSHRSGEGGGPSGFETRNAGASESQTFVMGERPLQTRRSDGSMGAGGMREAWIEDETPPMEGDARLGLTPTVRCKVESQGIRIPIQQAPAEGAIHVQMDVQQHNKVSSSWTRPPRL